MSVACHLQFAKNKKIIIRIIMLLLLGVAGEIKPYPVSLTLTFIFSWSSLKPRRRHEMNLLVDELHLTGAKKTWRYPNPGIAAVCLGSREFFLSLVLSSCGVFIRRRHRLLLMKWKVQECCLCLTHDVWCGKIKIFSSFPSKNAMKQFSPWWKWRTWTAIPWIVPTIFVTENSRSYHR